MVDVPSITTRVPSADLHLQMQCPRDTNARSATGRRTIAYQMHDSIDLLTWMCQECRSRTTQLRTNARRRRLTARVPSYLTALVFAKLTHESLITTSVSRLEITRILGGWLVKMYSSAVLAGISACPAHSMPHHHYGNKHLPSRIPVV